MTSNNVMAVDVVSTHTPAYSFALLYKEVNEIVDRFWKSEKSVLSRSLFLEESRIRIIHGARPDKAVKIPSVTSQYVRVMSNIELSLECLLICGN